MKKPISDPIAAFRAPFLLLKLTISSPKKAPKKGPKSNPNGPKNKIPTRRPIELPIALPLPPPNFFAPKIGMILSRIKIDTAMKKLKIKKLVSNETEGAKLKKRRPNQAVIGPGIMGKRLPAIPKRIKKPAIQIKRISICKNIVFYWEVVSKENRNR